MANVNASQLQPVRCCPFAEHHKRRPEIVGRSRDARAFNQHETEHPMRRSRFTEGEILHLLGEASAGVPVAEICKAAGVTARTFYRWRRQFGGLSVPAAVHMKELVSENLRLKGLVSNLFERLRASGESPDAAAQPAAPAAAPPACDRARDQMRATRIAAEKCGGALTGRFASVRVNP
jgi:putative transposase